MGNTDGNGKTVLVTGGSGFVGGWCVIELLRRGYAVRTTVRDLRREPDVRAAVGSEIDPGDNLTFFAADLASEDGWAEAIAGCDYLLHVASPFPPVQPKDPDELIVPAREGTLRVLRGALDAGVERIVITSSVAAIGGDKDGERTLTEADWTDPDRRGLTPYTRSKTIAERAAWDLVRERGEESKLATINPGAILGPVLNKDTSFSIELVQRLLDGMPGTPRIGYSCVDVRDLADLEIRAMENPDAGGKRFIAVGEFQWMADVAEVLRNRLGDNAKKVPKRSIPDFAVKLMSRFDKSIKSVVPQLGRKQSYSHAQAEQILGWKARPVADTIAETGQSLIDVGAVKSG